jgi:hypothetical protein
MQNKRTLFKVGCGAITASAIAAGVIFEVTQRNDDLSKFGTNGKLTSEDYEFMSYVSTYGKTYPNVPEYSQRQSNWSRASEKITKCNREQKHSRCAHNEFSTWSSAEL